MTYMLRGALIEYASDFLGPLPNVVVFQFNPESLSRTIAIPPKPTSRQTPEVSQAGEPPVERFTIRAEFDAAERLNVQADLSLSRVFGVGPQLAALEKMARPAKGLLSGAIGAAVDAIGSALGGGAGGPPSQPIPREKYPRLLFIWGLARILPVVIESLTITEQQYDFLLNPTRAEVSIGLAVRQPTKAEGDLIGYGAYTYTDTVKEAQALVNLAISAEAIVEMIPF
jgi:hypothetical protein